MLCSSVAWRDCTVQCLFLETRRRIENGCLWLQFDTDMATLRRQSTPWYSRSTFWWRAGPILTTLVFAAIAIALRVTSPNKVTPQSSA